MKRLIYTSDLHGRMGQVCEVFHRGTIISRVRFADGETMAVWNTAVGAACPNCQRFVSLADDPHHVNHAGYLCTKVEAYTTLASVGEPAKV